MKEHLAPTFTVFGMVFDLANIIMMVISCLLVFLLIFFCTRNMTSKTPRGGQNFLEWVIDFVRGIAGQTMDSKTAERFIALGLTLFLYVFIANQLGLIGNIITVHQHANTAIGVTQTAIDEAQKAGETGATVSWWKSPTATVSVPFALAIMVLFYTYWLGLRGGVKSFFKAFVAPHWLLLPLNIVEELSKYLSFPLRLYGNIFAGEVLIGVLLPAIMAGGAGTVMGIPLVLWIGYSIFVGAIQAFIFTILTMVYIAHRLHSHDEAQASH